MPWGNDSAWWRRRIRQELQTSDEISLDDLPDQPGLPEGLIEAVEELEDSGEITVTHDSGERIIHSTAQNDQ